MTTALRIAGVRVNGDVEELVAGHKLVVGRSGMPAGVPGVAEVIRESHSGKQASLLVRADGPIDHPDWTVRDITLEDLVLAYLSLPTQREVIPA